MMLRFILVLLTYLGLSHESPVPRYNPNIYYGPDLSVVEESQGRPSRLASKKQLDMDAYQDLTTTLGGEELPGDVATDEGFSPELKRLLLAYSLLEEFEETRMFPSEQKYFSGQPQPNLQRHEMKLEPRAGKPMDRSSAMAEADDYDPMNNRRNEGNETTKAEEADDEDDGEAPMSDRRTFGMIMPAIEMGITMLDQDLGLGLGSDMQTSQTSSSSQQQIQMKQTKAQLQALREAKEQATIDQLKTQATLEQMRAETEILNRNSKAELESIKSKLESVASQADRERHEKDELKIRLEHEQNLRDQDNKEMKRKLEMEANMREMEKMRQQTEMVQQEALRERQKMELKHKMEMDAAIMEYKSKKEETKKSNSETSYMYNQKSTDIRDLRAPAKGPTVGFV